MLIDTNLVLVLLFWIAPAIVIIFNLLWDIEFLQRKEYRLHRIYQTLRWDSSFTHRHRLQMVVKVILFTCVAYFVFSRSSAIPAIASLIAFGWWINEVFDILAMLIGGRRARPRLDFRGVAIFYLAVAVLAITPIILVLSIPSDQTSITKLVITEAGSILPTQSVAGIVIPAAYVAIIFSALLALAYDLAAPFIVIAATIFTVPFEWILGRIALWRAHRLLRSIPNLLTIVVTASSDHGQTAEILAKMLAGEKLLYIPHIETTAIGLARTILHETSSQTEIMIVELNAWQRGEMSRMCRLLGPQITILSGVDATHIGTFGSVDLTLDAKLEAIRATETAGTIIFNADDELISSLVRTTNHKEIICTTKQERLHHFTHNSLTVDHFVVKHSRTSIDISTSNSSLSLKLPGFAKQHSIELSMAAAAAVEAGVELERLPETMTGYTTPKFAAEEYEGDLGTTIWEYPFNLNYRQFSTAIEFITSLPEHKQRVLITQGVLDLGKYKVEVHAHLAKQLNQTVDILITPDIHLASTAKTHNTRTQIFHQENIARTIYTVRKHMSPGAQIILIGELHPQILRELRSELQ